MTTGSGVAARRPGGGSRARGRGRPSRLGRIGPAAGAGRWSLVAPLLEPRPTDTASAHATAMQLVERHGVVTREAVLAEGVVGGFASVYGVLKVLEDRGQVRRGYFVSGLGAAQFALPGAVDRLRSIRRPDDPAFPAVPDDGGERAPATVVLSATDPAQPYGGTLPWPESPGRPARIGAALVVLCHGVPLVWHDRRSHHLVTFAGAGVDREWADALAALVHDGRMRSVEIRKINGPSVAESPDGGWVAEIAHAAGFTDGYRGLVLRRTDR
jgi:ATP-dependent Lhr-like helicase